MWKSVGLIAWFNDSVLCNDGQAHILRWLEYEYGEQGLGEGRHFRQRVLDLPY